MEDYLEHHGVLGMKWGVRHYQNPDGSLTSAGRRRYYANSKNTRKIAKGYERRLNDLDEEGAYQFNRAARLNVKKNNLKEKVDKYRGPLVLDKPVTGKNGKKYYKAQKKLIKTRQDIKENDANAKKTKQQIDSLIKEATKKGYDIEGTWGDKVRNEGYKQAASTLGFLGGLGVGGGLAVASGGTLGALYPVSGVAGAGIGTALSEVAYGDKQGRGINDSRDNSDTFYKVKKSKNAKGTARYIQKRYGETISSSNATASADAGRRAMEMSSMVNQLQLQQMQTQQAIAFGNQTMSLAATGGTNPYLYG